jgi:hypothetical protein
MEDDMTRPGQTGGNRASLSPRAVRQRRRRRSLDQVIKIVEESNLAPEEQKQAAKLRRLLNDLDLPEAG